MASSRTVVSESDEDSEGSFEFSDEEGDVFDSDDEDDTGFGGDFDEDEDEDGFGEAEEDEDDEEESTGFADDGGDDEEAPAPTPSVGAWDKYAAKNLAEGCTNHYEHPGLTKVWSKPVTTITGPIQIVQAKISYKWLLNFMGDSPSDPKNEKSVIEKVGLLCKEGIKDANMAKELYCQLLKQLHKNSSKLSHAKGFILLNLYMGNFMPPADIFTSIDEAICNGPPIFKQFSQKRFAMLQSKNENRVFPPLRIELLAIKKREQVPLKVTFWGKETLNIEVHSVTTTAELTAMVANELDLDSAEGFGLRIRAGAAISGVGSGKHYILDALNDLDSKLGQGKWKLEFTKQEFAPWHSRLEGHGLDIASDQIAAALRGGRYRL